LAVIGNAQHVQIIDIYV